MSLELMSFLLVPPFFSAVCVGMSGLCAVCVGALDPKENQQCRSEVYAYPLFSSCVVLLRVFSVVRALVRGLASHAPPFFFRASRNSSLSLMLFSSSLVALFALCLVARSSPRRLVLLVFFFDRSEEGVRLLAPRGLRGHRICAEC